VVLGAGISGPSTSTTGTFTLTWTSGYYLAHAASNAPWIVGGPPATAGNFSQLPSGTYKFELLYLFEYWDEWGYHAEYVPEPNTLKTVTVTRDAEPALDTTTTEAGTTGYAAGVNLRGSSTVSIPLRTVPGVNGIAPRLSLEYESARGTDLKYVYYENDLLDYGWSLRGLSKIHYCAINSAPAKCLDGMPLKLVSGSGGVGSVYHTESQSQAKVTRLAVGYEVR